ncbi:MAG: heme ABC transporter permease CcmB [SAR202 cluster bacterium]|nr:heme ABC transporter permease CcmB [SAR202 cluster bacterium]
MGTVAVLVWKDLKLEFRSRDILVSVLVFGLLVALLFSFALKPSPGEGARLAPAILWVALAFSGTITVTRTFVREQEQGGLEGLLLTPASRDAIFLGKALTSFLFMLAVEAVLLPAFSALLAAPLLSAGIAVTAVLATLGFATLGTLFSAIAVQTRSREIMLPVLFFPIILPLLIGAVESSAHALSGGGFSRWLPLMGVFDALFLVLCPWAFGAIMEE